MNKEEIKEYLNRVEKLELKIDGKDKETFQWLIYGYNQCAKLLNENEQQNKKYKEVIDKAINDLNIIIDIVREQPLGSDCWIIDRLEANKSILKEVE